MSWVPTTPNRICLIEPRRNDMDVHTLRAKTVGGRDRLLQIAVDDPVWSNYARQALTPGTVVWIVLQHDTGVYTFSTSVEYRVEGEPFSVVVRVRGEVGHSDYRASPRVDIQLDGTMFLMEGNGLRPVTTQTRNLSVGGVCISSPEFVDVRHVVGVELSLPDGPLSVVGRVVGHCPYDGPDQTKLLRVQFTDLEEIDRQRIDKLVVMGLSRLQRA